MAPGAVEAYPYVSAQPFWAECGRTPRYNFQNTAAGNWTQAEIDNVVTAFNFWRVPRDYDNTMTVEPTRASGGLNVRWSHAPGGSSTTNGHYNCILGIIEINTKFRNDPVFARTVARHEMGHVLGLNHTGDHDSYGNDNPGTMTTCIGNAVRQWSREDRAAIAHFHTSLQPTHVSANVGFERQLEDWGVTGANATISTSGSANGTRHVRFTPTNSSSAIWQTVRLHLGGDSRSFDTSTNLRQIGTGTQGDVRVLLVTRNITYSSGGSSCSYYGGKDLNGSFTAGTPHVRSTLIAAIGTTWGTFRPPLPYQTPGPDAIDLEVRLQSTRSGPGGYATIAIDDMRVRRDP